MKRAFDIIVSLVALGVLMPVFLVAAVAIKLDSRGPVIFRQRRIGRRFRPFFIYKFRTMVQDAPSLGMSITVGEDHRITRVGRFLRRTKLDELPQLINVVKGEMALVGPRPEVPEYVELFHKDYEEILKVRPGITDLASLKYCDEAAILGCSENAEEEYVRHVLPEKIQLAKDYIKQSSILFDIILIFRTLLRLFEAKGTLGKASIREYN
jgi:lipopolysaccharide/colanic/teichoic acid biosynthesis glycosyltransferase